MAKGDGGIQQLGRGKWRVSVSFGNDPISGKRQRVTRVVNGTKSDARVVRNQIMQDHDNGLRINAGKVTFGSFARQWYEQRIATQACGKQRSDNERRTIKLLASHLESVVLKDITPQVVESLYATIREDKIKQHGSISGRTMRDIHSTMRQIMKKAVDYDLILRNPCDRVEPPKVSEPERESLSTESAQKLLMVIDRAETEAYTSIEGKGCCNTDLMTAGSRSRIAKIRDISNVIAVRIGLATGMRRGEVFGLSWDAIDIENATIAVTQSLTVYGEIKQPKTKAGNRVVSIDQTTAHHLARWKDEQAKRIGVLGIKQTGNTPVCCSSVGGWVDLHNFESWWRKFRKKNGFGTLKFHELRHTQATQLLANGVDVKTVQTRLGHSNASMTLQWYAHALPENDQKAARMIGELFESEQKQTRIIELKSA